MIKTFIRLWHALEKAKPFYLLGMFFMVIDSACQVMVPMFFRDVLNSIQDDAQAYLDGPMYVTLAWAGLLVVIFFPAALFGHAFTRIAIARLTRNLQVNLFEHVQSLSTNFFEEKPVGEITSRMSSDLDQISSSLGIAIGVVWGIVTMIYAFAMMVYVNVYLAGLFLIMLVIVALLMLAGLPIMKRKSRAVRDAAGRATASVTEYISINELIRSYAGEDYAAEQVDTQSQQVRKASEKLAWFYCIYNDATQVLVKFIAPFALLLIGAIMVSGGRVRIGDLIAFWGFWLMTSHSLGILFNGFALIFAGFASADRVFEFFDHTPLVKDKPEAKAIGNVAGEVHFDNVEFAYPSADDSKVLHGVDIKIEPGQMVAFVGHSGSGKSTLIKLLMRFYDPIAGAVKIDGQDIRELKQRSVRKQMALVMQNSYFFSGTVQENLLLAKPDATFEDMKVALQDANAWDFINEQPDGLQTNLGENGMKLSGGQRQRLSIARAFLKNPKILLMDEPTSALDAASEKQVQEAVKRIVKGRTSIMIAHRIVTIQEADVIFVMDQGKLLDAGSHAELLERCDLYRDACELQQIDQPE